MKIDSMIAEIESSMSQYKTSGLINKADLYRWTNIALKGFGQSICVLTEKVIEVKNGKAFLPEGFHSLYFAVYCSPKGYYVKNEKPAILSSNIWKERVERKTEWNSCEPCCTTESETIISEDVYLDDNLITFYYNSPIVLKLGKAFKKDLCTRDCKNNLVKESPYEINIVGTTLQTNFNSGYIYIQYYGLEQDEKGLPLIPDTPKRKVEVYIEYHLKRKLIEQLMLNGDDVNLVNMLTHFSQQERIEYPQAMSDAKFQTLTPNSYKKLMQQNRRAVERIESLIPSGK